MASIAFLGLGAMGSRMASNLIRAGHQLRVWNRSPQAVAPLLAQGAEQAATPYSAASEAEFVISMVRDDAASETVWCDPQCGALRAMQADAVAIESSTLSVEWIRQLAQQAAARNIALLEAPVSGSRPAAEAGQLVYLVGGESPTLTRAQPILRAMGAAIHHVGPIGAGTLTKLATNALLGIQVATLAELIGMLAHQGCHAENALQAIAGTPVWAPVANYLAGSMLRGDFQPQFPVELIEKDFGYTIAAAGNEALAPLVAAARKVFQNGIHAGLGDQNMTAVAQLYSKD